MLITPRPGGDRDDILHALESVAHEAESLRGPLPGLDESGRLLRYLEWATDAARILRFRLSEADVARLVLTPGYRTLLAASGTLKGARLINGLVNAELEEHVRALHAAADAHARSSSAGL